MIKKNGGIFGRNPTYNDVVVEGVLTLKEAQVFDNDITINGDLTVNGTETVINTVELNVDDKNITMGAVVAKVGLTSTSNITLGQFTVLIADTAGLVPGMTVTKTAGTGAFAAGAKIVSVDSHYQITLDLAHTASGSITFDTGGATDFTADGGGITLKGLTDKFIKWVKSTAAWTFSDKIEAPDVTITNLTASKPVGTDTNKKLVTISAVAIADGGTAATTAADARTNLGLGTMATQAANNVAITGGSISGITDLAVADGGTGASDAATARTNLGALASTNPSYSGTLTGSTGVMNIGSGQLYKDANGLVAIGATSGYSALSIHKQTTLLSGTGNIFGMYLYPTSSGVCYLDALTGGGSNTDVVVRSYNNGTYTTAVGTSGGGAVSYMQGGGVTGLQVNGKGIGLGTTSPASDGIGIKFPASQSASSDANCLDDYEEGTWTPTLRGSTTDPTISNYAVRIGKYTKIGNSVHWVMTVQVTITNIGSGYVYITGLPFAAPANNYHGFSLGLLGAISGTNNGNYMSGTNIMLSSYQYTICTDYYITLSGVILL